MTLSGPRCSALLGGLLLVVGTGCSDARLRREHASLCRAHARTIVADREGWAEYVARVRHYNRRFSGSGRPAMLLLAFAPDYDYQSRLDRTRANEPDGAVVRNDVDVRYRGRVVATLVNYNATIPTLGHTATPSCTSVNPEAYLREARPTDDGRRPRP